MPTAGAGAAAPPSHAVRVVAGAVGFALLAALWAWLSTLTTPVRLPGPERVLRVMTENLFASAPLAAQGGGDLGLAPHLFASVWRTLAAAALGGVLGTALGLLIATSRAGQWLLQPPLEVLRLVPSLIAVPFLVLWFGIGALPQFTLIVGYTLLVLQLTTVHAVRNLPPVISAYARTLGADRLRLVRTVLVPGALPELVGALRVAVQLAWGLTVIAELLGAQAGIGRMMQSMSAISRTDYILAGVLWLAVAAVLTDALFRLVLVRLTRWS